MLEASFVSGIVHYRETLAEEDPESRIILPIASPALPGQEFWAIVDTAASYCLFDANLVRRLDLNPFAQPQVRVSTRLGIVAGAIHRVPLAVADWVGELVTIDASVLATPAWNGPNFLGFSGFLQRIRFAVDPSTNSFYFGPY